MEEEKPLLDVGHLSVSFTQYERGFRKARFSPIRDLSMMVRRKELVAVVGSSGSGKSLLAHAILGILPYNASVGGEIFYEGERLTYERQKAVRGHEIVLVPQSVSYLDPLMKTGAQIRKGKRDQESKIRCEAALDRYGLDKATERLYPFELSGGMTRRVLIAAAVIESPRLVIADEPTPGLHVKAARRVLSHFREMAEAGAGVLLITHDLELALEAADRVVVLYAGTDVEEASASDFQEEARLRHPYTRALYRAMPQHGFTPAAGTQPYVKGMMAGCPYAPRCEKAGEDCCGEIPIKEIRGGRARCLRAV